MNETELLIKQLNELKILQTTSEWEENLPDDIYDKNFKNASNVAWNLESYKHRRFEYGICVYELVNGDFIGCLALTDSFNEMSMWKNAGHHLIFFEMEPTITITYKKKKEGV